MSDFVKRCDNFNTLDGLFSGRLLLAQPQKGYRFSGDSPLLIWFGQNAKPDRRCIDLGAGCGVVGLGMLATGQSKSVTAVEIQPELVELCRLNAKTNGLAEHYTLVHADIRQIETKLPQHSFELVVSNPPFWPPGAARLPSDEQRQIACYETLGDLDDWIRAMRYLLHPKKGRICLIYPARRLDDLLIALYRRNLSAVRLRFVYPNQNTPAELVLIEAKAGKTGRLAIDPPIYLKEHNGQDTAAAKKIYSGVFSTALKSRSDRRKE